MIAVYSPPKPRTFADVVRELGDIPLDRIRFVPCPGTATVDDALANKGCELVDGMLVEKAMGLPESIIAAFLIRILGQFAAEHKLGTISGEQGSFQILTDIMRMPDVAFISWKNLPDDAILKEAAPQLAPDLAVEVLSKGNTPKEIERKRSEYFNAGVRLVWIIDRFAETVTVWTSTSDSLPLSVDDVLDGGTVLPGLTIKVRDIFNQLEKPS